MVCIGLFSFYHIRTLEKITHVFSLKFETSSPLQNKKVHELSFKIAGKAHPEELAKLSGYCEKPTSPEEVELGEESYS
jgi:hypothetical protein